MKPKKAAVFLVLIFLFFPGLTSMAGTLEEEKELEAVQASETWLLLVDSEQYEKSWEEASRLFKTQVSKEKWVSEISRLRPIFGQVKNRRTLKAKYMTSAPGAPEGEYVLIIFDTSFEKKEKAIETVTPMLDVDGKWRISGYFIR